MLSYIYNGEYEPEISQSSPTVPDLSPIPPVTPSQQRGFGYEPPHLRGSRRKVVKASTITRSYDHTCAESNWSFNCDMKLCSHHTCGEDCMNNCTGFTCEDCHRTAVPKVESATQLLIHTKVYELADKYDVAGLKDLVKVKFDRACYQFWSDPAFAAAAHYAFSTTPEHDKGLRDIVSKTISDHMSDMIVKPEIETLLTEFNGLAYGLLKQKAEAGCFQKS
jgi:hypothetical protein